MKRQLLAIVLLVCGSAAAEPTHYFATKIDLGPGYDDLYPAGLTSDGTAVVMATGPGSIDGDHDTFLWRADQSRTYLPFMEFYRPHGVSPDGTIVGTNDDGFLTHGSYSVVGNTISSTRLDPGKLFYSPQVNARGINSLGQVVGDENGQVAIWQGPNYVRTDLGSPGGMAATALAINDNGLIVGTYENGSGSLDYKPLFPFMIDHGVTSDLPSFPSSEDGAGVPFAVNNRGLIVGYTDAFAANDARPATWLNGVVSLLPMPIPNGGGTALAVNNDGIIVGTGFFDALIWEDGQVYHLADLIDNEIDGGKVYAWSAVAINDNGQVLVSWGSDAYLLTLVPEPTNLVTIAMCFVISQRRRRTR